MSQTKLVILSAMVILYVALLTNETPKDSIKTIKLKELSIKLAQLKSVIQDKHPYQFKKFEAFSWEVSESSQVVPHVAYTKNKASIHLCLESDNIDVLFYVACHEMAHVMSTSLGHTSEFWENMRFVVRVAVENRIFNLPRDGEEYCYSNIGDIVKF